MNKRLLVFLVFLAGSRLHSAATASPVFPLKVNAGNRYLEDRNSKSFFYASYMAWSLIVQVSKSDADYFLDNIKAKGFNATAVNLIEHKFCSNPPRNFYGDAPFTGRPFATPNEAYFAHADYVINAAKQRGIEVALYPTYLGYQCGDEGWCAEIRNATTAEMRSWGRYIGDRYKNSGNILWVMGADVNVPSDVKPKIREVVYGIQEYIPNALFSAQNVRNTLATDSWSGESWLNVNGIYTGWTTYTYARTAYQRTPTLPFNLTDAQYENERGNDNGSTIEELRAQAYWVCLSGAFGHTFGNCPVWHFGSSSSWCGLTNWKQALDGASSACMAYVPKLFNSRSWHLLAPDFNHTVLTAGYGTSGDADYVTAARCSDGSSIIAYLPTSRQVTIDMTKVGGAQAKCWWYRPSDGTASLIGTYDNAATRAFTPSAGDWVLVIDNAALNLPAPGTAATGAGDGGMSEPRGPHVRLPPVKSAMYDLRGRNVCGYAGHAMDPGRMKGVLVYFATQNGVAPRCVLRNRF